MKQLPIIRKCNNCHKLKMATIRCSCRPDKYEVQKKYEKTDKGKAARHCTYINQILKGNR